MTVKYVRKRYENYAPTSASIPPKTAPVSSPDIANNPPVPLQLPHFIPYELSGSIKNWSVGIIIILLLVVLVILFLKKYRR